MISRSQGEDDTQITLSEQDGIRYLHFGSEWVQGAMKIRQPDRIVLDYVRQMMGWMLFLQAPRELLQLGLGAGALTRFCVKHLPATDVTVVELSPNVIRAAERWFALPTDSPRLTLVQADAQAFLMRPGMRGRFGVMQVDLYDLHARGPVLDSVRFYRSCRRALAETGLCVVNLFGEHASFERNLRNMDQAFDGRLILLPPGAAGNRVVLAFQGPPLQVDWSRLERRADMLGRRYGFEARAWVDGVRAQLGGSACTV